MKLQKRKIKISKSTIKSVLCIFAFVTAVILAVFGGFSGGKVAFADENEGDAKESLAENVRISIDALDTDDFQSFVDSLEVDYFSNVKDLLKRISAGENENFFAEFSKALAKDIGKYFLGFLPAVVTVVLICILKNTLSGMTASFLDNSTTEVVHAVCYATVVVIITASLVDVVGTVVGTVKSLSKFAEIVFPILLTLLAGLGSTASVATYQPMMAVLGGGIIELITKVILPAFIACEVFSVVGNLSDNVKLTKMNKLFRSASTWLVGIAFGLFGVFLTAGGISGGVTDRLGFGVAKFALSSYVPVLGGYLSDGFDLVASSLVLVKSAFGYTAVAVLVAIVLFPTVKLIAFLLSMRLASAIVEPTGDSRISNMLSSVADNATLLITALAGAAFMFFILVMLVTGTYSAL